MSCTKQMQVIDFFFFFQRILRNLIINLYLDIGVREFELNYSKMPRVGEMRLAGFPIVRKEEWAAKFLARGFNFLFFLKNIFQQLIKSNEFRYKVTIVDEKENSVSKSIREKTEGKKVCFFLSFFFFFFFFFFCF